MGPQRQTEDHKILKDREKKRKQPCVQRKKASAKEGVPRGECARIMLQINCKQSIKSSEFGASFASFLGVCCSFAWGHDEVCPFVNLDVYPKEMGMMGCKQEQKRWAAVLKYFGAKKQKKQNCCFLFPLLFFGGVWE